MHKKTIEQLHDDLKNKKITPQDLYQSSLKQLQELNPIINAANLMVADLKVTIDNFDNHLAGIPGAVKDNIVTKNIFSTSSSYFLRNFNPKYDATINERLNNAGTSMIAKTNLDEFGIGAESTNSIFGRVKNPYNTEHITGGSSGGSAAIVSAGITPYAIGSDTGDSVRRPALYCGVYGYKPTYTTISRYGLMPYGNSMDQPGIITRSIADIAIVLENIAGQDLKDPTTLINSGKHTYYQDLSKEVKPLKIAYIKEIIDAFDNEVVLKQFEDTKDYLKSLGHHIEEISVDKNLIKTIKAVYQIITNSEMTSNIGAFTGIPYGERVTVDNDFDESIRETRKMAFQGTSKARLAIGAKALYHENKEQYYLKAKKVREVIINEFANIFTKYDIIMTPGSNYEVPKANTDLGDSLLETNLIADGHLIIANLTGAPGIVIPTHLVDGLPYGVSLMSKPFADQLLLDLAYQFEQNIADNEYGILSFYNKFVEEVK